MVVFVFVFCVFLFYCLMLVTQLLCWSGVMSTILVYVGLCADEQWVDDQTSVLFSLRVRKRREESEADNEK